MDSSNRLFIVCGACAWIVAMAVITFLTWAAPDRTISRLGDFVQFLSDNNTDAGKLVVTLAVLAAGIIGMLVIVVEVAPDAEPKDLRVEQAGATLVIPADALRLRLEEALLMLPDVTAARTHVWTRDKGIAMSMELTVPTGVNVANVTQEAARVVVEAIQTDLGLPVSGVPPVKIAFGGSRSPVHPTPAFAPPTANPAPMPTVQTVDERISSAPASPAASLESRADSSPGPLVYDETQSVTEPPSQDPHSPSSQP
jgi:hypothetical protein